MNFHYGQDYNSIDGISLSPFSLQKGDTKYLKYDNVDVFDFVGFTLGEGNVLSVFPKHYYSVTELKDLNESKKSKF